ncbi:MAG: hypothetical protein ABIH83_03955 [Candidatus Micrarchaeota archaeon]
MSERKFEYWKKIAIVLATVILLAALNYSQNPTIPIGENEGGDLFQGEGAGYGPLINMIAISIAILVFISSLVYMASQVFKNPEWEAFAKTELYQALVSVLWGVFIFAGAIAVDGMITQYTSNLPTGYGGGNMFDIDHAYLQRIICVSTATTVKIEGMKTIAQYMAGMKSRFYAAQYGWGMSFPTFPGFDVIERALDLILMFISPFTASLIVQSLGLQIIHATALTLVLPAGILMRIFPPTRDAGSFLMASAIAFYFIFPFVYLINAHVMYQMYSDEFGYEMCSGREQETAGGIYKMDSFYDSLSAQMLPSMTEDVVGTGGFTKHLSYIAFQAVFLPAMTMIMVVTFVKSAMKFFSQKME